MKVAIVAICVTAIAAACAIAGCRMFSKRETAATIPLTAKPQGKIAIVYYSQSKAQNTAIVATWIQKHTGGDLLPLEMAEPYPESYGAIIEAVRKDIEAGTHPALKAIPDLAAYDIVFVGAPIWYGTYALPMATFLDTEKLAGKTVVPFCAHGGGGAGRAFDDIRKACPEAKVLEGLAFRGSNQIERRLGTGVTSHHTEDDVVEWLNRIFR